MLFGLAQGVFFQSRRELFASGLSTSKDFFSIIALEIDYF
jgi:hypothetical protein